MGKLVYVWGGGSRWGKSVWKGKWVEEGRDFK
jgi:hypothetical protein